MVYVVVCVDDTEDVCVDVAVIETELDCDADTVLLAEDEAVLLPVEVWLDVLVRDAVLDAEVVIVLDSVDVSVVVGEERSQSRKIPLW